jgi:hypothetical protein
LKGVLETSRPLFYPLQAMTKAEAFKKIKADFHEALRVYFDAKNSVQGRNDADTVYDIFMNHWRLIEVFDAIGDMEPLDDEFSVVDLDEDGLHMAHTYGSVFDSGVLKTLDHDSRQEIIEACIYALNARQVKFENEVRARWYEQGLRDFKGG